MLQHALAERRTQLCCIACELVFVDEDRCTAQRSKRYTTVSRLRPQVPLAALDQHERTSPAHPYRSRHKKSFSEEADLKSHNVVHNQHLVIRCEVRSIIKEDDLESHYRAFPNQPRCDQCQVGFLTTGHFNKHCSCPSPRPDLPGKLRIAAGSTNAQRPTPNAQSTRLQSLRRPVQGRRDLGGGPVPSFTNPTSTSQVLEAMEASALTLRIIRSAEAWHPPPPLSIRRGREMAVGAERRRANSEASDEPTSLSDTCNGSIIPLSTPTLSSFDIESESGSEPRRGRRLALRILLLVPAHSADTPLAAYIKPYQEAIDQCAAEWREGFGKGGKEMQSVDVVLRDMTADRWHDGYQFIGIRWSAGCAPSPIGFPPRLARRDTCRSRVLSSRCRQPHRHSGSATRTKSFGLAEEQTHVWLIEVENQTLAVFLIHDLPTAVSLFYAHCKCPSAYQWETQPAGALARTRSARLHTLRLSAAHYRMAAAFYPDICNFLASSSPTSISSQHKSVGYVNPATTGPSIGAVFISPLLHLLSSHAANTPLLADSLHSLTHISLLAVARGPPWLVIDDVQPRISFRRCMAFPVPRHQPARFPRLYDRASSEGKRSEPGLVRELLKRIQKQLSHVHGSYGALDMMEGHCDRCSPRKVERQTYTAQLESWRQWDPSELLAGR
ncbi:hypothetical protein BV25DRAFT_1841625 [Artomyces pyxidatus]|uniref:Uncharacterized protein n=1 Tax=Artomyces pyxidatus TaxID=48021 RepID=A0ACB8SN36_9AGAM|nr:hypothetical protein BV25DRAFT_1841625 [Artomyces pyxidatus]